MQTRFVILIILVAVIGIGFFLAMDTNTVKNADVSGVQLRSQIWEGTIHIRGTTRFVPGTRLTIKPGTSVLFHQGPKTNCREWARNADAFIRDHGDPTGKACYENNHYRLAGEIIANGTEDRPIIFTSAQQNPDFADWSQVSLFGISVIDHAEVSYSRNGLTILEPGSAVTNSRIHHSLWSCIDIFSSDTLIQGNEIFECWHQGVGIKDHSGNIIQDNFIHDVQSGINCERGNGVITNNHLASAGMLITPACGSSEGNTLETKDPSSPGGTYEGRLIYPSREKNKTD